MDLNNIEPYCAYRVKYGGHNFVIVDEIHFYEDNHDFFLVIQNNKFRERLYSKEEFNELLSEKEGFCNWENEQELTLKLVFCRYRHFAKYIVFNAANSKSSVILRHTEILKEDINSEMYKCAPWAISNLYFEK
tara:strand:+ start:4419 stop:4817 length:399 start_codon:yes stop_codon:yes gene_type:complete